MSDGTKKYEPNKPQNPTENYARFGGVKPPPPPRRADEAVIPGPQGDFIYKRDQQPLRSSGTKLIYQGKFLVDSYAKPLSARALAFDPRDDDAFQSFGVECASLGALSRLGVGPRLLDITQHCFGKPGAAWPIIIEEDVGENLATLIIQNAAGEDNQILHKVGTPERDLQNRKIMYDVSVQLLNAHRAGLYHRDLRCENVCVSRFGENPTDIRATVIDFELGAALTGGVPTHRAPLYHTLFSEVISFLGGNPIAYRPTPLVLDMGYLAAIQYHLECRHLVLNGDRHSEEVLEGFVDFLHRSHINYFGYRNDDHLPYATDLRAKSNYIGKLARKLNLKPANRRTFKSRLQLDNALQLHRPYLDGKDMEMISESPEARLGEFIDKIVVAKFETYKALRREQGKAVLYEKIEDQPADLRRSNYAQAEHIPTKVHTLGYLLVPQDEIGNREEITEFSIEEIERLARLEHARWMEEREAAGWTLDKDSTESDAKKKTSPYLVPYDDLDDGTREFDLDAARQLITLVKSVGLAVVRP